MNRLKLVFAAALLMMASVVSAGLPIPELLSTNPAAPRANQQFDLIYTLDFCGDLFAPDSPSNRTVEVDGNVIRIVALYVSEICIPGQPFAPDYVWRIGPFDPGTYHLELRGYNEDPENSFPIASGEVTVLPAIAAPEPDVVPAASKLGLLSLSLLTGLAAMWGLWRRSPD